MPFEEIQIRINKEGWVYVDTRGLPADHVRTLSEHLEEVFGPRVKLVTDPEEMPPQTINLDEHRRHEIAEAVESKEALEAAERERRENRLHGR